MLAGFALLAVIDRFVYPVCPTCSHTHDHDHCAMRLHGFAPPLIIATLIHSFFDGWALAAAQIASRRPALRNAAIRLDLFALAPGRLPRHIPDAWRGS